MDPQNMLPCLPTIDIESNRAPVPSCHKSVFTSITMPGFRYKHPVDSSLHHILVSFLNLEIDFNAIFIPVGINIVFIDLELNNSALFLNNLLMGQQEKRIEALVSFVLTYF